MKYEKPFDSAKALELAEKLRGRKKMEEIYNQYQKYLKAIRRDRDPREDAPENQPHDIY